MRHDSRASLVGTMKQEMPRLADPGSVTAKTSAMSAVLPEVMNCFTPFSTQPLPLRTRAS